MSTVIRFLESQGAQPAATPLHYAAAVAALDIEHRHKQALLHGDRELLDTLLDTRRRVFCAVFAADED